MAIALGSAVKSGRKPTVLQLPQHPEGDATQDDARNPCAKYYK